MFLALVVALGVCPCPAEQSGEFARQLRLDVSFMGTSAAGVRRELVDPFEQDDYRVPTWLVAFDADEVFTSATRAGELASPFEAEDQRQARQKELASPFAESTPDEVADPF
jgi:hypothetical protein